MITRKYKRDFIRTQVVKAMRQEKDEEKQKRLAYLKFVTHAVSTNDIELSEDDVLLIYGA